VRSDIKSATLPDSTGSGGFWEERNAKAKAKAKAKVKVKVKVNKSIKIHVEWAVSDCGHLKKEKIPNEGDKNPPTFFLERKERFSGG
jgi:hypothetical protein